MPRVRRKGHKRRGVDPPVSSMDPMELAAELRYWRQQVECSTPFRKLFRSHAIQVEIRQRFQADIASDPMAAVLKKWGAVLATEYMQKVIEREQKGSKNDGK